MFGQSKQELQVIDESMFYQLLGGSGTVYVDISCIEEHFIPFVSFAIDDEGGRLPCGAIIRNQQNLLAADSIDELIDMLHFMAGGSKALKINFPEELEYLADLHRTLH